MAMTFDEFYKLPPLQRMARLRPLFGDKTKYPEIFPLLEKITQLITAGENVEAEKVAKTLSSYIADDPALKAVLIKDLDPAAVIPVVPPAAEKPKYPKPDLRSLLFGEINGKVTPFLEGKAELTPAAFADLAKRGAANWAQLKELVKGNTELKAQADALSTLATKFMELTAALVAAKDKKDAVSIKTATEALQQFGAGDGKGLTEKLEAFYKGIGEKLPAEMAALVKKLDAEQLAKKVAGGDFADGPHKGLKWTTKGGAVRDTDGKVVPRELLISTVPGETVSDIISIKADENGVLGEPQIIPKDGPPTARALTTEEKTKYEALIAAAKAEATKALNPEGPIKKSALDDVLKGDIAGAIKLAQEKLSAKAGFMDGKGRGWHINFPNMKGGDPAKAAEAEFTLDDHKGYSARVSADGKTTEFYKDGTKIDINAAEHRGFKEAWENKPPTLEEARKNLAEAVSNFTINADKFKMGSTVLEDADKKAVTAQLTKVMDSIAAAIKAGVDPATLKFNISVFGTASTYGNATDEQNAGFAKGRGDAIEKYVKEEIARLAKERSIDPAVVGVERGRDVIGTKHQAAIGGIKPEPIDADVTNKADAAAKAEAARKAAEAAKPPPGKDVKKDLTAAANEVTLRLVDGKHEIAPDALEQLKALQKAGKLPPAGISLKVFGVPDQLDADIAGVKSQLEGAGIKINGTVEGMKADDKHPRGVTIAIPKTAAPTKP